MMKDSATASVPVRSRGCGSGTEMGRRPLVTISLDTEQIEPTERAEAIREMICGSVVGVEMEYPHPRRIAAQVSVTDFGRLTVCSVTSSASTVERTLRLSKDDLTPSVVVVLQVSGSSVVVQGGREAVLRPGSLAVCTTTAPCTLLNDNDIHQHLFRIPLADLALPARAVNAVTAIRLSPDRPVAGLAATYLKKLAENARALYASGAEAIGQPSIELVRALITAQLSDADLAREPLAQSLEQRVMDYARAHLADHELGAAQIAAEHHISVRHLYSILARCGISLGEWVRAHRLEECRKDLAKPGAESLTIAFIAQRWGFGDATNFGRAFKAAYGLSPRDWRNLHQPDRD
jgi:AraC-like DNA-binding protein